MGMFGRTGIPGVLIGNAAEVILNNPECLLLVVGRFRHTGDAGVEEARW